MKPKLILSLLVLVSLFSCKKYKQQDLRCADMQIDPNIVCCCYISTLKFNIIDKITGSDVVFGTNSTLLKTDIKLFFDPNLTYSSTIFADSTAKNLISMNERDTMYLQIKNEPKIKIIVNKACGNNCGRNIYEINYGNEILTADDNYLFKIKR